MENKYNDTLRRIKLAQLAWSPKLGIPFSDMYNTIMKLSSVELLSMEKSTRSKRCLYLVVNSTDGKGLNNGK